MLIYPMSKLLIHLLLDLLQCLSFYAEDILFPPGSPEICLNCPQLMMKMSLQW